MCSGLLLLLNGGCGGDDAGDRPEVTVLAAASLSDAMSEIATEFERVSGTSVELSVGASSALREQVLAGAPADVFASANASDTDVLVSAGEVRGVRTLARNRMQIAVPAGNPGDVEGLDDLARPDLLVGLCAPEVPCGAYGREALAAAGVEASVDTEAADARALLTQVSSGDLDVGLVYETDVLAAAGAVEGLDLPPRVDVEVEYLVATVSGSTVAESAEAFVAFTRSPPGRRILAAHGFRAP